MKAPVKIKMVYTGTVIGMEEAAASFAKRSGNGGTGWCHHVKIKVLNFEDCDPIEAQICTNEQLFSLFDINDDIKFHISTLSPIEDGRHTIQFDGMVTSARQKEFKSAKPLGVEQILEPLEAPQRIVTGTIPDRALYITALHFQYRTPPTTDEFFGFCDKVCEYLSSKLK